MIREGEIYAERGSRGYLPTTALVRAWSAAGAVQGLRRGFYVADPQGRMTPGLARLWWAAFATRPPVVDPIFVDGKATAYLVGAWPS